MIIFITSLYTLNGGSTTVHKAVSTAHNAYVSITGKLHENDLVHMYCAEIVPYCAEIVPYCAETVPYCAEIVPYCAEIVPYSNCCEQSDQISILPYAWSVSNQFVADSFLLCKCYQL